MWREIESCSWGEKDMGLFMEIHLWNIYRNIFMEIYLSAKIL